MWNVRFRLTHSSRHQSNQWNLSRNFELPNIFWTSSLKCKNQRLFFDANRETVRCLVKHKNLLNHASIFQHSTRVFKINFNLFSIIFPVSSTCFFLFHWLSNFVLEQCTTPVSEWNTNDLIRGNDTILRKVRKRRDDFSMEEWMDSRRHYWWSLLLMLIRISIRNLSMRMKVNMNNWRRCSISIWSKPHKIIPIN